MYEHDEESFFRYFRMTPSQFDYILTMMSPFIYKDTTGRSPVSPTERLATTVIGVMSHECLLICKFRY